MRSMMKRAVLGAAAAMVLAMPAMAAQIFPVSYSMVNGDGVAHGGSVNYWDKEYTGSGSKTTDGALLSGGLGNLTDGVIATQPWSSVENIAGTGPYVGWNYAGTRDPTITFNFANSPNIGSVTIYLDNTGIGGVLAPAEIRIDNEVKLYTPPVGVGLVNINALNLVGNTHTIQLKQASGAWVFVSEIQFYGTPGAVVSSAPEPGTWSLMIAGFGLAGAALRRRRATLA